MSNLITIRVPGGPNLIVVPDNAWIKHLKKTNNYPWYAKRFGDRFAPGGFYRKGAIHFQWSTWEAILADKQEGPDLDDFIVGGDMIGCHELGHARKMKGHSHGGFPMALLHAFRVGFDVRTFSRILRFRKGGAPGQWDAWREWFKVASQAWKLRNND